MALVHLRLLSGSAAQPKTYEILNFSEIRTVLSPVGVQCPRLHEGPRVHDFRSPVFFGNMVHEIDFTALWMRFNTVGVWVCGLVLLWLYMLANKHLRVSLSPFMFTSKMSFV